jgi:hypothetical protein
MHLDEFSLKPTTPAITINDVSGNEKVILKTGNISSTAGSTIAYTISSIPTNNQALQVTNAGANDQIVFFNITGISITEAGIYAVNFNDNALQQFAHLSDPGFNLQDFPENPHSFFVSKLEYYIEFLFGGEVVTSALIANVPVDFDLNQWPLNSNNQNSLLTFNNTGSHTVHIKRVSKLDINPGRTANVSGPAAIGASNQKNLSKQLNFVEIADGGIQVISGENSYARIRRNPGISSNDYIVEIKAPGLGSTFPTALKVDGNIRFTGISENIISGDTLLIDSIGNVGKNTSSRRYKTDITDWNVSDVMGRVMNINPVTFKYKTQTDDGLRFGMIAEDLDEVGLNEAVVYREISGSIVPDSINYEKLSLVLWKCIQELNTKIEILETKITKLID